MKYPEVYLAIDNCFAYKRWTKPDEWCGLIKNLGVRFIEASADNELDPLFMGTDYLEEWVDEVRIAESQHDVKVVNLYSGHATYALLGIANPDVRARQRMIERWFYPMISTAKELGAGLGFLTHAFPDRALQNQIIYEEYLEILTDSLSKINQYASTVNCGPIGVEQMYSPHIIPWTIQSAKSLLREVRKGSGSDFYLTEDVGHHTSKYVKPSLQTLTDGIRKYLERGKFEGLWLGREDIYAMIEREVSANRKGIDELAQASYDLISGIPYMFSQPEDADCYSWLREIGAYCPIVHLQQTDGENSPHWLFTEQNNARGIILPERLLTALKESYERADIQGMPMKPEKVYLTLEAFSATASINHETIRDYQESVKFWRQYVVEDGIRLNEIAPSEG